MKFGQELLPGVELVMLRTFYDARGSFVKTFGRSIYEAHGVRLDIQEEFYSFSRKNVVRGMHFQLPPHDHAKLVFCPAGAVLDVLVDLRAGPGFGRVASVILEGSKPSVIIIPSGIAHGFKSLKDESLMVYKTTTEHMPTHDAGIRWDSIDFDWQVAAPILSTRDAGHTRLGDFDTPFVASGASVTAA